MINILKKKMCIYSPFVFGEIKRNLSYKLSFYLKVLSGIVYVFITYYLWMAIYNSSNDDSLAGFSRNEMIVYIFMAHIVVEFIYIQISDVIGEDVINGSIAMNLFKPISYRSKLMASSLGNLIFRMIFPSIIIWVGLEVYMVFIKGESSTSIISIIMFLISCFLAFIIYFLFDFCFGLMSFYSNHIWGLLLVKNALLNLLTGQLIPFEFFPKEIKLILENLPFASMNYTPVMIYLNKLSARERVISYGRQVLWIVVLYIISNKIWNNAIKKLSIMGG